MEIQQIHQGLREKTFTAVSKAVREPYALVAFSGGVDSSVLGVICRDLGKETTLLTVGFPDSPDLEEARNIAEALGVRIVTKQLDESDLEANFRFVKRAVKVESFSQLEDCLAFYYVSMAAADRGFKTVSSANGPDELFCGYDRFRRIADNGGSEEISKEIERSLRSAHVLARETEKVGNLVGVKVVSPFLEKDFVDFCLSIPVSEKVRVGEDRMRKWAWRKMAVLIGVPEGAAMKPKKAIQYSTKLHEKMKGIDTNF